MLLILSELTVHITHQIINILQEKSLIHSGEISSSFFIKNPEISGDMCTISSMLLVSMRTVLSGTSRLE